MKTSYNDNKFKILAPTWNDNFNAVIKKMGYSIEPRDIPREYM